MLEDLRRKYREMLAMRLAHDAGDDPAARVRARMAGLALHFPGALREIDDLELDEIRRRIGALEAVLHENAEVERWMSAVALFHVLARGALCAKRWLAGRRHLDAEVERAYAAAVPTLAFPQDAGQWINDLPSIASPPRGRVTDLVMIRIGALLGTDAREARVLVFGVPRRDRKPAGARE
jgi:hypothetical protein